MGKSSRRSRSRSRSPRERRKRSRSRDRRRSRSKDKKKKRHKDKDRSRSRDRRRSRSGSRHKKHKKHKRSRSRSPKKSKDAVKADAVKVEVKAEATPTPAATAATAVKTESAAPTTTMAAPAPVPAVQLPAVIKEPEISEEEKQMIERRERVLRERELKAQQKQQNTKKGGQIVDASNVPMAHREKTAAAAPAPMGAFKTPQELRAMWDAEDKKKEQEATLKQAALGAIKQEPVKAEPVQLNTGFSMVSAAPKRGQMGAVKMGGFSMSGKKMTMMKSTKKKLGGFNFGAMADKAAQKEKERKEKQKFEDLKKAQEVREQKAKEDEERTKQEEEDEKVRAQQRKELGEKIAVSNLENGKIDDQDVDALDAYMSDLSNNMTSGERYGMDGAHGHSITAASVSDRASDPTFGEERFYGDDEKYSDDDFEEMAGDTSSWLEKQQQKGKGKELKAVDHSLMEYLEFDKKFYIESPDISGMTEEEVKSYRENELEGVKLRGKGCPRPIKKWIHCGLSNRMYKILNKEGLTTPFPIQAQAIPAIMSGRDVIACAKTGSGKTLAFVLPMMRHILDQPELENMEGPIAIIMAPTRELAIQIHLEVKKFAKPCEVRNVAVYGGAGVAAQIADLKRGAEVITCTPGRMIDILCANNGRVTNLTRCTYVVLDEADRMFDMGFAPQIMAIIDNIRPDRQTVMFSATFPRSVEMLAKRALNNPIEIIIGGRSTASGDIKQLIEVRQEDTKFRRLLELLGKWYAGGNNILIFVDKQEAVDNLFRQLIDAGYPCLALHGGMDQTDRDYTISDFKTKLRTLMVATSVVARGLDVKDLVLVINYTVPNHYEDYVHRVGRTGRAGKKGTAITFLTPEEDRFAPDLVKGLEASKAQCPEDLKKMAEAYNEKRKRGEVVWGGNDGFSGSKGYKFDDKEDLDSKQAALAARAGQMPEDEAASAAAEAQLEKEREKKVAKEHKKAETNLNGASSASTAATTATAATSSSSGGFDPISAQLAKAKAAAAAAAAAIKASVTSTGQVSATAAASAQAAVTLALDANQTQTITQQGSAAARAFAVALSIKAELSKRAGQNGQLAQNPDYHTCELEINDYPQHSRWKVTHKKTIDTVVDMTDCCITTKGMWFPPGRNAQGGERKLYLLIEGKTDVNVKMAKAELVRILEEAAIEAKPEKDMYSKYSVLH